MNNLVIQPHTGKLRACQAGNNPLFAVARIKCDITRCHITIIQIDINTIRPWR